MKNLVTILALFTIISCKKEISSSIQTVGDYAEVQNALKDSLTHADFRNLNFSRTILTKMDSNISFLRIPFIRNSNAQDFVLLQLNRKGKINRGFIISLRRVHSREDGQYSFNGTLQLSSLSRSWQTTSPIVNGFITPSISVGTNWESRVVPSEGHVLPEVIVTTYVSKENTSAIPWLNITSFFSNTSGGSGNYVGVYSSISDQNQGSGGGGTETNDEGVSNMSVVEDQSIFVDFEFAEDLSAINIDNYIKCFSNVPDIGATCSIEILTDIPVDNDPNKLFNWQTSSPGHTFLQLTKTNGSKSVMQNIGFYPVNGLKTLFTTAPVAGKLVDNGEHEFNAGLKMQITQEQLKNTLIHISYLSSFIKYDIDNYNCTDFALEVFNISRTSNPIEIPRYDLPGGMTPAGSNTPQGLFNKIKSMQRNNIESSNINIPGVKGFVAGSDGPCN